jgi:hypothetical protein
VEWEGRGEEDTLPLRLPELEALALREEEIVPDAQCDAELERLGDNVVVRLSEAEPLRCVEREGRGEEDTLPLRQPEFEELALRKGDNVPDEH